MVRREISSNLVSIEYPRSIVRHSEIDAATDARMNPSVIGGRLMFPRLTLSLLLLLFSTMIWQCYAFPSSLDMTNPSSLMRQKSFRMSNTPRRTLQELQRVATHRRLELRMSPKQQYSWDGDDLRWWRRWSRRRQRRMGDGSGTPARNSIIVTSIVLFLYQTYSTVDFIRRGYPSHWPSQAIPIVFDALVGSSIRGPLIMDLAFSNLMSRGQPHRFLTSGLLHGGLLHLLLNVDALRRQPAWLENGLGFPLYLTCMFVSIMAGNIGHMYGFNGNPYDRTLSMGLSGGISGLYGLMYVCLVRMGNPQALGRTAKGLAILFIMGLFIESVNNYAHIGGFLGGVLVGVLCSPRYRKSYSMRRKNSVEYDPFMRDYRQAMGFGMMPTDRGLVPLPLIWAALLVAFTILSTPGKFRAIPNFIMNGIRRP